MKFGPPKRQADSRAPRAGDPVGAAMTHFTESGVWTRCPGCGEEYRALGASGRCLPCEGRSEAEQTLRRQHRARLVEMMGERGADEFTFDRFRSTPGTEQARGAAGGFNPEHHDLFLTGPAGTGKTHLAGALASAWLWKLGPREVEFHKVTRLLRWFHLRKPTEYEAEVERLARLKVLVLDDLGVEKASEYNLGTLYDIIDARWMGRRRGLVVTSNLSPEDLAAKLDDDRLASRLFGMCSVYRFVGKDMRLDGKGGK